MSPALAAEVPMLQHPQRLFSLIPALEEINM
jgi:hypothetical protein